MACSKVRKADTENRMFKKEWFTYQLLNNKLPSVGQTTQLHHFKFLVQVFFSSLSNHIYYWHKKHICQYQCICNGQISVSNTGRASVFRYSLKGLKGLISVTRMNVCW